MNDYLVTFFIGNNIISKTISELIENRDDLLYLDEFDFPKAFKIPFVKIEDESGISYIIKNNPGSKYETIINDVVVNNHAIQNGDYYTFRSVSDNKSFKALVLDTSKVRVNYKKYYIEPDSTIFVGRDNSNDIVYNLSEYVSRSKHIAIKFAKDGSARVEDIKRSVGMYVNGKMTHSAELFMFDEIYLMGLSLIYCGNYIAVLDMNTESSLAILEEFELKEPVTNTIEKKPFVRTPRILKSLDMEEVEIDAPPSPVKADDTPAVLVLGPSITMSIVMLGSMGVSVSSALGGGQITTIVASSIMTLGMLAGSLLWPSLLRSYQKRKALAEENYRKEKYTGYISDIENELIDKTERSKRILNDVLVPCPEKLCGFLDTKESRLRLWERNYGDEDFLYVRIGLGDRPVDFPIKVPRTGFQLHEDELRKLPEKLKKQYGTLSDAPLTIDLFNNNAVGIIGKNASIIPALNEIILNIVALHSYDEVKVVILTTAKDGKCFDGYKNIPHVWSNDRKIRYFATNTEEVHYLFNSLDEIVKERFENKDDKSKAVPHYVIIVTDPLLVDNESLLRYLDRDSKQAGLSCIFAYGDISKLPKCCGTIIQCDKERSGFYIRNENKNNFVNITTDKLDDILLEDFTHNLASLPIKRDEKKMGIVDRISFMQMMKAGNIDELEIEQHWENNNSAKSLAAPIGCLSGGKVFALDLHESYHGCHGLVAGTTGSGKSEFLQAFILSLAINYSPKEIAFVLVDFKGGDMARPFMPKDKPKSKGLPHLAATISNLSGNIVYRALVSLNAEIQARQSLFNECAALLGVDKLDINSYHKYFKSGKLKKALPHLVIIIDEFGQLKSQLPEFMTELINVAQVGRSLGIHLILATQKPSGIVDPQIMSNSRFKVCLKVAEKQDSIDMINRADSALIKNPGRLNLLVGYNEVYETIQSGYSGADYEPTKHFVSEEEITVQMTDNTGKAIHSSKLNVNSSKSNKSQLEAIVAELSALGERKGCFVKPLWLEPLPEKLDINSLAKGSRGICTTLIGLADFVKVQQQRTLCHDFCEQGHLSIYGVSGMGKTTLIHSIVYSMICQFNYSPEELNLYIADFGGRNFGYLENLPHTQRVLFADEEEKAFEMVEELHNIIEERKVLFAEMRCGTFKAYREENKLPAIVVIIDNYASLHDKYYDLTDALIEIVASGKNYGVYFVVTGNTRDAIYYKIAEHIECRLTLKMNDPTNYMDIHNIRPQIIPENIYGRGITVVANEIVEFQAAIPSSKLSEGESLKQICNKYNRIAEAWYKEHPKKENFVIAKQEVDKTDYSEDVVPQLDNEPIRVIKMEKPEPVLREQNVLVLGKDDIGNFYGVNLNFDNRLCVCGISSNALENYYKVLISSIIATGNIDVVFIDSEEGVFKDCVTVFKNCVYVKGIEELDVLIESLKAELNERTVSKEACQKRKLFIFGEFMGLFEMMTDVQAAFWRKVIHFVGTPEFGICYVCGYNVTLHKNYDELFMNLIVNAGHYVLTPNSYDCAMENIETLPDLRCMDLSKVNLCIGNRCVEIGE